MAPDEKREEKLERRYDQLLKDTAAALEQHQREVEGLKARLRYQARVGFVAALAAIVVAAWIGFEVGQNRPEEREWRSAEDLEGYVIDIWDAARAEYRAVEEKALDRAVRRGDEEVFVNVREAATRMRAAALTVEAALFDHVLGDSGCGNIERHVFIDTSPIDSQFEAARPSESERIPLVTVGYRVDMLIPEPGGIEELISVGIWALGVVCPSEQVGHFEVFDIGACNVRRDLAC